MMADDHISDEVLIAYADDPESAPAIEAHLRACSACWNALSFYRTLNAELREEETWRTEKELTTSSGLQAVRDFADRIASEDAEAARLLEHVIDSPYRFTRANIITKKRFHTGGVVRKLCEAVREQCDLEPPYAMELVQAAQAIAESLPNDYYPAAAVYELRGRAWKEYATVCQYLGRFQNGLDALHRAESAYRHLGDSGLGLAAVKLSRAILLWKLKRYSEALPLARSAAADYASRRETRRYVEAQEVEAVILQGVGNLSAAREIYRKEFNLADSLEDVEMKARAAGNLGINYRDSGDLGNASKYLIIALQLFQGLGQGVKVARTRWSIARLSLAAGNFRDAERYLRVAQRDLEEKGLRSDATEARLDLAEALLMLDELEEVESLCTEVAGFYRQTRIVTGALTAATFLKEAAVKRLLRREHIQQVRDYLVELNEHPELAFATPPMSLE
jgi:tetratricopeptide (TPR) repeat protein